MRAVSSPLKFDVRAHLFGQLALMEEAGLPLDRALSTAQLPVAAQERLTDMRRLLGLGLGLADAGMKSGLFTALEASLLRVAVNAGSPARTYRHLANSYERRAARVTAMKSRLLFPMTMSVVAIFVNPLPLLVTGSLSPASYLLRCLLPIIALGGAAYLFARPPQSPRPSTLAPGTGLERVCLQAPLFGAMAARRSVRDFFDSLALLLEAGVPILDALPAAVATVRIQAIKQQFSKLKSRIEAGSSFAQAVRELSFVGRDKASAMILTGETSGKLPEMLFRYSEDETIAINQFDDIVAEWLPRIVYSAVALLILNSVISSGAFMPSLPPDAR